MLVSKPGVPCVFIGFLGGALCDSASCMKKLRFRRVLQFLKGATRGEVEPVLSILCIPPHQTPTRSWTEGQAAVLAWNGSVV